MYVLVLQVPGLAKKGYMLKVGYFLEKKE